ncbi:MAG: triose-phosphate isomerase [Gammaproteobacteria bacterium]|nr:triose-phosphate isomerase [Gammaproteobacteria bacterium]
MRKKLVAGNWKLNGSSESNRALLAGILEGLGDAAGAEVMVCPPAVYLSEVAGQLDVTPIMLGAQNVAAEASGAFTGEVSAAMLQDVGCTHTIIGHSERRTLYGETDEIVAAKFIAAQAVGLVPILCIGETQQEREGGVTMDVISRQIRVVLETAGISAFDEAIVAYEPVWAIGTGLTASPEQAQEVHAHIRSIISAVDAKIGAELQILYGGSVKGANAAELFTKEDIDGGLIGGASLDASDFLAICIAAAQAD